MVMSQNSVPSELAHQSGIRWTIGVLLLAFSASISSCANDAFLPQPQNLPYTQEHEQDTRESNAASSWTPSLHDTF